MDDPVITEIVELHAFFDAWYAGRSQPGDFERMETSMAPEFHLVTPDGHLLARDEIIGVVRTGYGSRPIRIWIEDAAVLWREGSVTCARYQEWQDPGTGREGRLSTALFRDDPAAPHGVVWLHVHETRLPA
jgi:hypothetical protein